MASSFAFVSTAEEMNPAFRQSMEDEVVCIDGFDDKPDQGFFAVFDGHGGRGVVDFVKKSLERNLRMELAHNGGSRSVEECMVSAYLISDIETSKENLIVSGSTAVTCLVRREGAARVLYAANVGDTRAVLCRAGQAIRLTVDHKTTDPAEVKRIEASGGFVVRKRVLGVLSVTRSFGDHAMKRFVVARPHTSRTELAANDAFLIIACDGVWDVLSDQDACDVCRLAIEQGQVDQVASVLVKTALARGTTDNVSVCVVGL